MQQTGGALFKGLPFKAFSVLPKESLLLQLCPQVTSKFPFGKQSHRGGTLAKFPWQGRRAWDWVQAHPLSPGGLCMEGWLPLKPSEASTGGLMTPPAGSPRGAAGVQALSPLTSGVAAQGPPMRLSHPVSLPTAWGLSAGPNSGHPGGGRPPSPLAALWPCNSVHC